MIHGYGTSVSDSSCIGSIDRMLKLLKEIDERQQQSVVEFARKHGKDLPPGDWIIIVSSSDKQRYGIITCECIKESPFVMDGHIYFVNRDELNMWSACSG